MTKPKAKKVKGRTNIQARIDNTKLLLEELGRRDMSRDEITDFLHFSKSGARKYTAEMESCGVIYVHHRINATPSCIGIAVFRLLDDQKKVGAYLDNVAARGDRSVINTYKGGRPSGLTVAQRDPTRHIHLVQDDCVYAPRVPRNKIPAHTDLMAAFYGMGSAQVEA